MPKMKTNRAAAKRYRVTASGRVRRSKAGKAHIMRFKSANRLRRLKKNDMVADVDVPHIKVLMPYAF